MRNVEVKGGINTIPGDVGLMEMHGGVCYLKGNVSSMNHYGGVVYDQRHSDRVEFRDNVIDAAERKRLMQRIDDLNETVRKLHNENMMLRRKLKEQQEPQKESNANDDVLVQRICLLRNELEKEREAHKKDVEDMNYRIDVAMEVNAKLRTEIKQFNERSQLIADDHIDILASILALYPYTPNKDLEFEFGIPANKISDVARVLGGIKSKEARREAQEYLHKQHRELIQRRGGKR